jgi:hypothetical protein
MELLLFSDEKEREEEEEIFQGAQLTKMKLKPRKIKRIGRITTQQQKSTQYFLIKNT